MAEKDNKLVNTGSLIGGGTLIGMGIGFLTGNVPAYMFIGMGFGLVLSVMVKIVLKSSNQQNDKSLN